MITFILIIVTAVASFYVGRHTGIKEGYDHSMNHVHQVIVKLEKLYRNGI